MTPLNAGRDLLILENTRIVAPRDPGERSEGVCALVGFFRA